MTSEENQMTQHLISFAPVSVLNLDDLCPMPAILVSDEHCTYADVELYFIQVREQAFIAGLDAAANMCESVGGRWKNPPQDPGAHFAAANGCAAAIRSIKEKFNP